LEIPNLSRSGGLWEEEAMQQQVDKVIKTLKSKGLRVTPQRFAVYANLLTRADHPTAEQILFDLNQDAPTSSHRLLCIARCKHSKMLG
jgi:Fur family transcriptional regulator, peroxide stress response regulator